MRLIIGIGGASGALYGIRLLEVLRDAPEVETHLVMSKTARMNVGLETDWPLAEVEAIADVVHKNTDIAASVASGSFRTDGMIVAACSMKNLAGIVHGLADDLLTRAADVVLKERRRLVLMPRETPLHLGHCEAMAAACRLGAIVAPPMPALYARPASIDAMVTQTAVRVLDLFDLDLGLAERWIGAAQGTVRDAG
ncbi:3-octaprenyl-4-hydroxybenzoate carboxy-lyase [Rhodothalassium salexigens]|uniref:UbiX family flavin prenyltransferase n=1 Tax=Rhodothalassium salexigens TaxID=1086 RepID=UPI0019131715|nr:UbiX family flavin prenyltransferase [Rhodothalassium salexigens]MBK5910976.1 3-octaprenyl-4-hydroxybenzoate carboxy-lyase [Rhodothalassium salexigens]MBK5921245.1 3-octaprenyl-4-hydroxybenzoate carboxy-lyase [Rhodothalassium salexigens]